MIRTFADSATAKFWKTGKSSKGWPNAPAKRKLQMLDQANELRDVATAGNRLEKLAGNRKEQYSIRVNDQYRVCFDWEDGDAYNVEITKHYD